MDMSIQLSGGSRKYEGEYAYGFLKTEIGTSVRVARLALNIFPRTDERVRKRCEDYPTWNEATHFL